MPFCRAGHGWSTCFQTVPVAKILSVYISLLTERAVSTSHSWLCFQKLHMPRLTPDYPEIQPKLIIQCVTCFTLWNFPNLQADSCQIPLLLFWKGFSLWFYLFLSTVDALYILVYRAPALFWKEDSAWSQRKPSAFSSHAVQSLSELHTVLPGPNKGFWRWANNENQQHWLSAPTNYMLHMAQHNGCATWLTQFREP